MNRFSVVRRRLRPFLSIAFSFLLFGAISLAFLHISAPTVEAGRAKKQANKKTRIERPSHALVQEVLKVTDPLVWLDKKMNCDEFKEQIRVRYGRWGSRKNMSEEQKWEIDKVLEVSCSARFSDCNFSSCKVLTSLPAEVLPEPTAALAYEVEEGAPLGDKPKVLQEMVLTAEKILFLARNDLRQIVEAKNEKLKEEIGTVSRAELKQGLIWQKMVMENDYREKSEKSSSKTREKTRPAVDYQQGVTEESVNALLGPEKSAAKKVETENLPVVDEDEDEETADEKPENTDYPISPPPAKLF